jgi:hypothetical protein
LKGEIFTNGGESVDQPLNAFLLRAIRIVVRADSDPVRQALFANLKESRLPVRLAFSLHACLRGTSASALLVSGYGLAFFMSIATPRHRSARVLTVARHANARRQVARVVSWLGADTCDRVDTRLGALLGRMGSTGLALFESRASFVRAFRVVRAIDRRHSFLVSCRVAGALAWYARAKAILSAERPEAVLVSSDSNPEELGFTAAARALGIPSIFISHAYPTPFSPPLDFSLSTLGGNAEVEARRRRGHIRGEILLAGLDGDSMPLNPRPFERTDPVIGIFAPKAVSWPTLVKVISDCRRHFRASQIVIRWHPSMLEPARLARWLGDLSGILESPRAAALAEVARPCDWVIADENSSVHLPVLKLGIPTIAVKHLGRYPESRSDMYGFVRDGIVLPAVASIRDVQPEALAAFFSTGWTERFQRYDASYLRPQHAIEVEARDAIWRVCERATSKATRV